MKDARRALDAERLHIAEELHSGIAQHLTHLRLELSQLPAAEALESVAAEALQDLRRTIYVLNGLSTPGHLFARILDVLDEVTPPGFDKTLRPLAVTYLSGADEEATLAFVRATVARALAEGATRCVVELDATDDGIDNATVRVTTDLNADADHILTIQPQQGAA